MGFLRPHFPARWGNGGNTFRLSRVFRPTGLYGWNSLGSAVRFVHGFSPTRVSADSIFVRQGSYTA